MWEYYIDIFKSKVQIATLKTYFRAVFGPLAIVALVFLTEQLFEYFFPFVSPRGIDGIAYLWLHTTSLLFILGFAGVLLLRTLFYTRKYLRVPWNVVTPPFSKSVQQTKQEVNPSIIRKAKISSTVGLGGGAYLSFLLQFIGFVPYRKGMVLTGPLGRSAPSLTVPTIVSDFPIISDLIILGNFIASPHSFGYIMISLVVAPIVIGFWNLSYLFLNYDEIIESISTMAVRDRILFRWLPVVGLVEVIIAVWQFGLYWFFH